MRQLSLSFFVITCLFMSVTTASHAATGDINVLKAREAFDKEKVETLTAYTNQLQAQHHILAPYARYWLMTLKLPETKNGRISDFLTQYQDYAFAQRLRGKFLRKLGKEQSWGLFAKEYARFESTKNTAVECLAAEHHYRQHGSGDLASAKHLWLSARDQPNDCNRLFDAMQAAGVVDEQAIWQRFRMATAKNRVTLARAIIKRSKGYQSSHKALVSAAYKSPEKFLKKRQAGFNTKFGREVNLFALVRLAKKDTWDAVVAYKKLAKHFRADEKSHFHAMLGMIAAKRHEPEAQLWFQKADTKTMSDEQISWYARAALRQSDWSHLLTVIAQMKPEIAEEARWRYWKARALMALKRDNQQAVSLLTDLGVERHYYGWLAQDELRNYKPPTLLHYKPSKKEIAQIGKLAGVKRAAALLALDLRWEGTREWKKVIASFDDKKLLAASHYANQQGWYILAINTADDTRGEHDFSMRYLMPYKTLMTNAAQNEGIDVAWVHGLVRQESRFMHYAKSRVGAAGLMQLMPTTARWAAKKAGVSNYKRSMIHDLDVNVTIGTYYLAHTLDVMDGNKIMATAGYNAGPGRAKRWRGEQTLEGPIYAETIPFNETRGYVQRVMANMLQYAKQMGIKGPSLKALMGRIPAKPSS